MSDEPQPPPLRLRPRARSEEAAATPPAVPVTPPPSVEPLVPPVSPSAPSESEPAMRLRLKPKLAVEAEPETVSPVPSPEPLSAPSPFVQPFSVIAPPAPATENGEIPRLKLKPLPAGTPSGEPAPAASVTSSLSDLAVIPAPPPLPPPIPMEIGGMPVESVPLLKPLAVLKTDTLGEGGVLGDILVTPPGVPFKPPARGSGLSIGRVLGVCGAILLVLGGGYYAFRMFTAAPPAVSAPAAVVSPKVPVPTPVVVAPPVPVPPASVVPSAPVVQAPPVMMPPVQAPSSTPPVKPRAVPVRVVPQPGPDFLVWVDSVKISGVINSSPPRAIVNGLLVRPGDTIDSARGIVFDHLDATGKEFFFRDRSGAITSKSY